MRQLHELQVAMGRSIVTGDGRALAGAICADGLRPEQRLQIYHNHFRVSLIEALAATFPVVQRLLSEACFAAVARRFVMLSPPREPRLQAYGAGFPTFLAAVPSLRGMPYLADVARLEWAMNAARHAEDAPALLPSVLQRVPARHRSDLTLRLHPAARLVASPYPVDALWRANQPGADGAVDLSGGEVCLLIYRDAEDDVIWQRLSAAEFGFLRWLRAGRSLGEAWTQARDNDDAFDLQACLAGCFAAGLFTDFSFAATPDKR